MTGEGEKLMDMVMMVVMMLMMDDVDMLRWLLWWWVLLALRNVRQLGVEIGYDWLLLNKTVV